MIVEDTPDLLNNLKEFLEMEGYVIWPHLTAKLAMQTLEGGRIPDLIITDLSMADMDGFELIEWIRTKSSLDGVPVTIFSARPVHENQTRAASLGVSKYLKKPCPPDELLNCIQEILK